MYRPHISAAVIVNFAWIFSVTGQNFLLLTLFFFRNDFKSLFSVSVEFLK